MHQEVLKKHYGGKKGGGAMNENEDGTYKQ